jgi:hypothetical protein
MDVGGLPMGPVIDLVTQNDHYLVVTDGSRDSRIEHEESGDVLDRDTLLRNQRGM